MADPAETLRAAVRLVATFRTQAHQPLCDQLTKYLNHSIGESVAKENGWDDADEVSYG